MKAGFVHYDMYMVNSGTHLCDKSNSAQYGLVAFNLNTRWKIGIVLAKISQFDIEILVQIIARFEFWRVWVVNNNKKV